MLVVDRRACADAEVASVCARASAVLFESQTSVLSFRRQCACAGLPIAAGTTVTTWGSWIEELWALFGDGRSFVSRPLRMFLLTLSLRECGSDASRGMVQLAERISQSVSGLAEFEAALRDAGAAAGVAPGEALVLDAIARYRTRAKAAGFIEPGEAVSLLGAALPKTQDVVVFFAETRPSLQQARFFEALEQTGAVARVVAVCSGGAVEACALRAPDVRFAFPSGALAAPRLVVDAALDAIELGNVVITAADPAALFAEVSAALLREGVTCAVRAAKRFTDTDFGRAWAAVYACAYDQTATPSRIMDFLLSPFSGVTAATAREADARIRGNRLITIEECRAWLRRECELFSHMEELATDVESSVVVAVFEDLIDQMPATAAYRREQRAAMGAVRAVLEEARCLCERFGVGNDEAMELVGYALERVSFDTSRQCGDVAGGQDPDVLITSQRDAAALLDDVPFQVFSAAFGGGSGESLRAPDASGSAACATLMCCDMTAEAYPAQSRDDASATLLRAIGVPAEERFPLRPASDALACLRATFSRLIAAPSRRFVIERCLFDAASDPAYPTVVVQEFVNFWRSDLSDTDEIDNPYALPDALQENLLVRGEEHVFENAAVVHGPQRVLETVELAPFGSVSDEFRSTIVLPREVRRGVVISEPCLSPSQIESYLDCPFKWLAQRRLRLDELDEDFGPMQMGDFAHFSLESFYRHFKEDLGYAKVSFGTIKEARALMRDVLDRHEAKQFELTARDNRLVPANELERRDVAALKNRLVSYLDTECQLLPSFAPAYLEYEIPADAGIRYGGYGITGKIDRIDIDEEGRAVIIDYKGSLSREYDLSAPDRERPRKVQTLIYARAVERLLGMPVVAALYVGYGRRPLVSGAFDPNVISRDDLPAMRHDACVPSAERGETFSSVLDATEELVGKAIDRLARGDVAPDPASVAACTWCPVQSCPKRRV